MAVVQHFTYLAILATCAGCATSPAVTAPPVTLTLSGDASGEVAFWNAIDHLPLVTYGDAVHAMRLFVHRDGSPAVAGDYAAEVADLKSRGLLDRDFAASPTATLDRGSLAKFVAVALKLPRGLSASVFGLNGRYAIRELEFRDLMPLSSPNQLIRGTELIGVLARASDYADEHAAAGQAAPQDSASPMPPSQLPLATRSASAGVALVSRSVDASLLAAAEPPAGVIANASSTTAPTDGQFVVTALTGRVSVRPPGATVFVPATVGMALQEGTEISTGFHATATLHGPGTQSVQVKPLSRMTFSQITPGGGVLRTAIEMDRGQVAAEIDTTPVEGVGQKYDLQVQSPRSTLAIKGTRVALADRPPFDVEATSYTGTAVFDQFERERVAFGRKNGGTTVVTGRSPDPAAVALKRTVADPGRRAARTASEQHQLAYNDAFGMVGPIDTGGMGGSVAFTFNLTWDSQTDVRLLVLSQGNLGADGVSTPGLLYGDYFDSPQDHGSKHGGRQTLQLELPPTGIYTVLALNAGDVKTKASVSAFEEIRPLTIFPYFFDPDAFPSTTSQSVTITPHNLAEVNFFAGNLLPTLPFLKTKESSRPNSESTRLTTSRQPPVTATAVGVGRRTMR